MKTHTYHIDNNHHEIDLNDTQEYITGSNIILSNEESDVTYFQDWYDVGYTIQHFLNDNEFNEIKHGVTKCIQNIVETILNTKISNFKLENYHNIITNNDDHYKVVSQTRDLFPKDFSFSVDEIIPRFENILNFPLTDIDPNSGWKAHIILRINRPYSNDYNPPHKDIYEQYDGESYIPKFVNFWVPICGVTQKSMLPISPKTHRLPENLILRTNIGSCIGENKYRVRAIKKWDEKVNLYRYPIKYGQVLIFSPHLIHGLAINEEPNTTRVSLEFRLYKHA
jgi:hypothetical protein